MPDDCKDIEGEIRTDTHRRNFFKLIEEDINELINPYRDEFVYVNCPACDNDEITQAFVKGQFSYYICPKCDTLFVNPRPTKKNLDYFYLNSKAMTASAQSLLDNEEGRKKNIFIPRFKLISDVLTEHGKTEGRLLEVGCSVGTFLELLKMKSAFSVEGVDPSNKAYEITKTKGIKVYKTALEDFVTEVKYDVVLNFETIEHVFDPVQFLLKINCVLKNDGLLAFSTPNYHGFDMMVLDKYYKNIQAPSHLNYFNVDTIDNLLKRAGFEVVKKTTPGILDVCLIRKQIEEGVAPEVSPAIKHLIFNTGVEVQENLQKFLRDNCLSGNMLIFARKVI